MKNSRRTEMRPSRSESFLEDDFDQQDKPLRRAYGSNSVSNPNIFTDAEFGADEEDEKDENEERLLSEGGDDNAGDPLQPRANNDLKWRQRAITSVIPESASYGLWSFVKGGFALVAATIVSITGFRVAGKYAGIWATTLGWSPGFITGLSASSNIIANIFVRSIRIVQAINILRRIRARWNSSNRMAVAEDGLIKNVILLEAFFAFIATAPWVLLVFTDLPADLLWRILTYIFIPVLTFVVEGSLAVCALTGYFNLDKQMLKAVEQWKYMMLEEYRSLMTKKTRDHYPIDLLERASRGEVTIASEQSLRFRKWLGNGMAAAALPYSITVGYGVYTSLTKFMKVGNEPCHPSVTLDGGFWDTTRIEGISGTLLISSSIRFCLLSIANRSLAQQVVSSWDKPVFNINGYTVDRPAIKHTGLRKTLNISLILLCFIIGFFSVGTASGLSLKNYFCDFGSLYTLFISLSIGMFGAFGINTGSVYNTVVSTVSDLHQYSKTRLPGYNSDDRLGEDDDHTLLIASDHIARMSPDQVIDGGYLVTYDSSYRGSRQEAENRGLSKPQALGILRNRNDGIYNNYADGPKSRELKLAIKGEKKLRHSVFFAPEDSRKGQYPDGQGTEPSDFDLDGSAQEGYQGGIELEVVPDADSPAKKTNIRRLIESDDEEVSSGFKKH